MYHWLEEVIKNQYQFVKNLKKSDCSEVNVYRNKNTEQKVVVRKIRDGIDVYEKLLFISCDNLPQIYEVARGEDEALVLEEYISGISVGDVLESGLYTEEGTITLCEQVCNALEVLHYQGIIHRDVKPENIMVTDSGVVKLIDFNASKTYKEEAQKDTKVLGTQGFAAPEQFGINQSDSRTDIYAMGVLINVMLTGEHPVKKVCEGRLSKVVKKATNMSPKDRYQDCDELRKALK